MNYVSSLFDKSLPDLIYSRNFKKMIFNNMLTIEIVRISNEIAPSWILQNSTDYKSTLFQV